MIVKHFDIENKTCFFGAEEVQTCILNLENNYRKKVNSRNNQKAIDAAFKYKYSELGEDYPEVDPEAEEAVSFEIVQSIVKEMTGWIYPVEYVGTKRLFKDIGMVCAVLLKSKKEEERKILIFNECVYLMTDAGKTIEKLI